MAMGAAAKTAPARLVGQQRQDRAVELRVLGRSLEAIAGELGYSSRGAVSKAITASMARQGKPAAEELAQIHMARLELAAEQIMRKLTRSAGEKLTTGNLAKATLSLTRVLAAEARYVDVYSQSQGLGPVTSLLEQLLLQPPAGVDPDDPMTVPSSDPEPAG